SESWLNYFVDFENYDDFDFQKMKQKLSEIDIPSMYNAYGLYSRKCIESYLEYTFQTTKKVEGMERLVSELRSYGNYYDIEQNVQFDKLIISGSPLYREIVSYLNGVITYKQPYPLEVKFYSLKTAQRYMELILRRSADNELNYKVKLLLDQHKKVLSTDYVPEISFFDTNKNEVSYKNFTGQKPTVFYFSDDWVGQRYQMEEYVKENKDVNFVMVTEGNNFREWKEYQDHAEPLVTHLFFNNDSITFKELFFRTDVFFVFDKKGKLASIERGLKEAYNKAKASLEYPKFEWNQSILRNIILVLGIILFVVIFTLLIVRLQAQRKLKKENQLRRLRELELTAIRSQMNPHFLFNSLNSVQNLIQQNKGKEAHVYLSDFAGLIRKVLKNSEKQESSLAEELEMTEQYIKLEKLRFDFDYTVTVDEEIDTQNTMVPSMLMQPFAENAVIHGLQNKPADRRLKIEALKTGEGIKITLEDNGIGREAARKLTAEKNGKGIKMNRERLELLREKYGEKYRLEITDLEQGTRVVIIVPEEN
ncbi:MAG: histidine kinase, partial [Prolixibacteraceae bacterium]|nr:histidine kinase [Prolixibacteraceae bacterium]